MTCQGQRQVLFSNANTVIRNSNSLNPTLFNIDGNNPGVGIDCIFQQLLHHRGRALYYLPGRYLVGETIIKLSYFGRRHQPDSGSRNT